MPNYIEQDGEILPAYDGINQPRYRGIDREPSHDFEGVTEAAPSILADSVTVDPVTTADRLTTTVEMRKQHSLPGAHLEAEALHQRIVAAEKANRPQV